MKPKEFLRLYFIISGSILLIVYVTTISIAEEDNGISKDTKFDLFGIFIGVIIPSLILIVLGAIAYSWLMKKKELKKEQVTQEYGLRATSTSRRRHEQDISISGEQIWDVDNWTDGTIEEITLNILENAKKLKDNKVREYYAVISKIIRNYVEVRFNIKPNSTTGEILDNLPQSLAESTVDHVGEILRICDIVEFAQYNPSEADLESIYNLAVEFIENQIELDENEDLDSDEFSELLEEIRKL